MYGPIYLIINLYEFSGPSRSIVKLMSILKWGPDHKSLPWWPMKIWILQSNLVIRNFLVTLKMFLKVKCSLSLWSKLLFGHVKWFLNTNLFLIKTFLITKFDCTSFDSDFPGDRFFFEGTSLPESSNSSRIRPEKQWKYIQIKVYPGPWFWWKMQKNEYRFQRCTTFN